METQIANERIEKAQSNDNVKIFTFNFHDTKSINADMGTITLVIYKDKEIVGEMNINSLLGMPQTGKLFLSGKYRIDENEIIVELDGAGYFISYSYGTKAYKQKIEMVLDTDWSKGRIPSLGTNEVVVRTN